MCNILKKYDDYFYFILKKKEEKVLKMHLPGIEPGSHRWQR